MWKQPWGYKEGYVICGGLFLTGLSLQAAVGGFHLETLAYPINLLAAVVFFLLLLLLHFFRRKFAALRWLSSYQAAISSISSFTSGITISLGKEIFALDVGTPLVSKTARLFSIS